MRAKSQVTEGLVLRKEPSGEHFLKLHCLSAELGALLCLMRQSSVKRGNDLPDLFDTAELSLEVGGGESVFFVKGYRLLKRRSALGVEYARLQAAAEFSRMLLANTRHMHAAEPIYELSARTFDLLEAGAPPPLILLKALYLLARDEGYPVRESWLSALHPEERGALRPLLFGPIPEQLDPAMKRVTLAAKDKLVSWLTSETDFSLPR